MSRTAIVLGLLAATAACSAAPERHGAKVDAAPAPVVASASAIARAYSQDANEADLRFVGHRLSVDGDVRSVDRGRVTIATGDGPAITAVFAPADVAKVRPGAMIAFGCDRIDHDGGGVRVDRCSAPSIAPAA